MKAGTLEENTWARFAYMKLATKNSAWRGCVSAVAVCLKLTSYLQRLQLITQSANGAAYKPLFEIEADLKQSRKNTCLVHCISSLPVAYSLYWLPCISGQNVYLVWQLLSTITIIYNRNAVLETRHILYLPEAQLFVWLVVCHIIFPCLFSVIVLEDN